MSATRIVGIPCAGYPVLQAVLRNGWRGLTDVRSWWKRYGSAVLVMFGATLGAGAFFLYCLLRWGRWDLYMLTQQSGWAIIPDYLAVFKPASYRWLIPAAERSNPSEPDDHDARRHPPPRGHALRAVADCSRALRLETRVGFYFCAAVIYYISVSGVASVQMESMLRYEFCVHALIVLAFLHFLRQLPHPATVGAREWHGGRRVAQRGWAQRAGVVRVEFHEGQLGSITRNEN